MDQILGSLTFGDTGLQASLCHGVQPESAGAASSPAGPMHHRDGSRSLILKGQPRIEQRFDAPVIARRILSLYDEYGPPCLARIRGPFALAIIDTELQSAILAIDRMGIETLCWGRAGDGLVFGTSASAVAKSLSTSPQINPQALFDFMLGHMVAAPDSAYLGITKLLPGTYLTIDHERIAVHRYWKPDFQRPARPDVAELRAEVLPTLSRAIANCAPNDHTGAFLSGGLDSSTVTGLLTRSGTARGAAFSVGFGVDEYDELSYARIASEQFGCAHHVYEVVPQDVVENIPKIAAAYDEPFGNSSAVPTFCCALLAKSRGINHLLAGDGGDELFGGNSRYVRHQIFELYAKIPHWARASLIGPLAAKFDPESSLLPFRKFASYVEQAQVPLPERFESWNLIYREGARNVFDAEFLASVDTNYPLRRMRDVWESCPSKDLLDRMLWYDWKFTLADNDLRKVSRMCELAGVRVSYPMLDEDVVDLSIRVPSHEKIAGRQLRTFFKEAVRGFLPEQIIRKEKHGFGLPFSIWLKTHRPLQQLVYGNLESLRDRRIFDRAFVDRVAEEHRSGHASYYGYAIWDMVMLEQWFRLQNP